MTDVAIIDELSPVAPVEIIWKPTVFLPFHPNAMTFKSLDDDGNVTGEWTVYSVGGGALSEGKKEGDRFDTDNKVYEMHHLTDIMHWCEKRDVDIGNMWIYARAPEFGTICWRFGMP